MQFIAYFNRCIPIYPYALGKGQAIESVMAAEVGTKVFKVYQPCLPDGFIGFHQRSEFRVREFSGNVP